nr:zinc finger, CCHC-type [Tanacetum cinerariifolium]
MGDENPLCTLGDYSNPSHEGYRNTIELPVGNNVVPLRSDTIRLVQNECSFHKLWITKLHDDILMFQQHLENLYQKHGLVSRTYYIKSLIMALIFGSKSKFFMTMSIPSQDEPLTNRPVNDPRDFAKPIKEIALPQDVPSTSDRRLIMLKNQVQRLMEAHLAPTQPTQVNKVTISALWEYWKLGSDEIKPTNEEPSDLEETNHDDEQKIGEIFRSETNLFDYETPLCEKFKEYILKIDPNLLTKDIEGFKTYEEFNWRNDGYCNGRNLAGAYIIGNTLRYQDLEWYDALKDSELKEKALRNKAIMEGLINEDVEPNNKDDEDYVAVKEDEYKDLTSTSKDAYRAYQEIFRMIDEGWMVKRAERRKGKV